MRMNQYERRFDFHGLGAALKRAREEKGWTQAYVAELVDRDSRTIMNIENKGQYPSFDLFVKLITMFDVSVDQFIHADEGARSSSLIMLLSAILKSNVAVMAIPVGIMILTMMVDIPYQFRLASQVYDLLPTNILNKTELWDDRLICIWGKYFTNFQIAPFLYVVFAVLLVIIGMAIYQRHQVQAR